MCHKFSSDTLQWIETEKIYYISSLYFLKHYDIFNSSPVNLMFPIIFLYNESKNIKKTKHYPIQTIYFNERTFII